MRIYIEGGGDGNPALKARCRQAFKAFFEKASLGGYLPEVIACGARSKAYERFCDALADGEEVMLLVDSEAPIPEGTFEPWIFLRESKEDQWQRPHRAKDEHCHLMVQCMENWFLVDLEKLEEYLGEGFLVNRLPKGACIESIADAEEHLRKASEKSRKGKYQKGLHSFALLALVDPEKVMSCSPWAKRFIETLRNPGNGVRP